MKKILLLLLLFFSCPFYAQKDTLSIIRHSENDLVIPKNKKLVFRGINNELLIDVPNCKSFKVSGDGLSFVSNNIYNVNPGAGKTTIISIEILLKNNKKITEKQVFEIRNITSPITYFNYINADSIIKTQKENFKNATIRVLSADKNLNFNFNVVKFKLKIPGNKSIQIQGNKINNKAFEEINKYAGRYDQILIYDIGITMTPTFQGCIRAKPMVIEIY